MSLVEVMIILAVLGLLTSVLAPSMGDFVSDAKQTNAKASLDTLCASLDTMLRDTGETFFLRDGHSGPSGTVSHDASNRVEMLVGDGRTPDVRDEIVRTPSSDVDWNTRQDNAAVQSFGDHLVVNQPSGTPTFAYRTGGRFGWRGAYLGTDIFADPWGRRLAANVEFLGSPSGGAEPSGSLNSVIVLSAGPNGIIETTFASAGVARGGDDVHCLLSGVSQ